MLAEITATGPQGWLDRQLAPAGIDDHACEALLTLAEALVRRGGLPAAALPGVFPGLTVAPVGAFAWGAGFQAPSTSGGVAG